MDLLCCIDATTTSIAFFSLFCSVAFVRLAFFRIIIYLSTLGQQPWNKVGEKMQQYNVINRGGGQGLDVELAAGAERLLLANDWHQCERRVLVFCCCCCCYCPRPCPQVYNEQIMDLLSPSSKPLRINEDPSKGVVVVAGLTEMVGWHA